MLLAKNVATKISADAVAKEGIDLASGARNKQNKNNTATVIAVNPVLPPADTPAPLSIYCYKLIRHLNQSTHGLIKGKLSYKVNYLFEAKVFKKL
jgi:hypothetical protein